ncbi:hypothetical protein COB47_0627 [Caldicellulosiruptor obsidiansis OB47]|uniref:Uncharacterized protein n=1 Tax=Caldicellulosiruptor obsidiansis (strain ATCC BAA-2073 / JCM 16842 / OB47) TaxID=608506 RepID=D9TIW2_CALOO|nr:hypothetical protein COB47_0627 [Caldicellulosiruptor obsidiansis OB47]
MNGAWFFTAFVVLIIIVREYIKSYKVGGELVGYYIPVFFIFLVLGIIDLFNLKRVPLMRWQYFYLFYIYCI